MELKNKRGPRASETQKMFLIEYLEERPDLANDKFTTADGSHARDKEWTSLSTQLNGLGGTIKDGPKWRKYWKDLTISVRSRETDIKEQRHKTGVNGILPIKELTELDKRIINIITPEAVEAVSSLVGEVGFEAIVIEQISVEPPIGTFQEVTAIDQAPMLSTLQGDDAPSTSRRVHQKRRRILSSSTDDVLQVFKDVEMKKIALEEKKNCSGGKKD